MNNSHYLEYVSVCIFTFSCMWNIFAPSVFKLWQNVFCVWFNVYFSSLIWLIFSSHVNMLVMFYVWIVCLYTYLFHYFHLFVVDIYTLLTRMLYLQYLLKRFSPEVYLSLNYFVFHKTECLDSLDAKIYACFPSYPLLK